MAEFKQHEEKMKAYQENRSRKEKPPIAQSTKLLHQNNENQPPVVVPKVKGGKEVRSRAGKGNPGTSSMRRSSNNNVGG